MTSWHSGSGYLSRCWPLQPMVETIPIVDLFAGPGGLGEGFSSLRTPDGHTVFRVALSIEMDAAAHRTLELRSFFRQFADTTVPDEYYLHLQGRLYREELFDKYPIQSSKAKAEAWNAELGKVDPSEVDRRIKSALAGAPLWALCGGPPCQAYSVIGRSRNGGISAEDHRVYLYREYLRILAVHRPPLFILENVKGLLSSKVGSNGIFKQMMTDLGQPQRAVHSRSRSAARYHLYSLIVPPRTQTSDGPEFDYRDFIIKCEDYGIPQSRHRVILLGVREDLSPSEIPTLVTSGQQVSVAQVLRGLPRLRSGLSRTKDGREEWRQALAGIVTSGVLHSIPNGKGTELRSDISWTLGRIRDTRADRGGEFVTCKPTSDYRPGWYCAGSADDSTGKTRIVRHAGRNSRTGCTSGSRHGGASGPTTPSAIPDSHRGQASGRSSSFKQDAAASTVCPRPQRPRSASPLRIGPGFPRDSRSCGPADAPVSSLS